MSPLLLSSHSLISLVYILTAATLLLGLRRTQEGADYKSWLRISLYATLLWHLVEFINNSLRPDLISPVLPYSHVLFLSSTSLVAISQFELAYLFPIRAFTKERKWLLGSFIFLAITLLGVQIHHNFSPHAPGWRPNAMTNSLSGILGVFVAIWCIITYLRKARYFRNHQPQVARASRLMLINYVGVIGTSLVVVWVGAAITPLFFAISWTLLNTRTLSTLFTLNPPFVYRINWLALLLLPLCLS